MPKARISRDGNESGQALTGPAWSRTYLPKQETQEMQVQSLEEGMTAHSGILAGRMPRAADYSPWGHTESDTTERLRTASSGWGRSLLPGLLSPQRLKGWGIGRASKGVTSKDLATTFSSP